MSRWFRWYRGTSENPKFRLAARNGAVTLVTVMAVWQVILEDAANEDHRGICEKKEDFIAAALDLEDDGTVEGALRGLEYVGLISIGVGAITVCRWEEWQYDQDVKDPTGAERQKRFRARRKYEGDANGAETMRNGAVTAEKRPDTDTDTDTSSLRSEVSNSLRSLERAEGADDHDKAKPKARKGTRLPEDWKLNEGNQAYAQSLGVPEPLICREAEKFRDFWIAKPGAGGVKLDWDAMWRNWIRRFAEERGFAPPEPSFGSTGPPGGAFEAMPNSPQWHAWHYHRRQRGERTALMESEAKAGRPYIVPSEWPPDYQHSEAA